MQVLRRIAIGTGAAAALLLAGLGAPVPPSAAAGTDAAAALVAPAAAVVHPRLRATATPTPAPTPTPPPAQPARLAREALAQLPVKGRAPKTGYERTQFGAAWTDIDHNGCDQRNDILRRDLVGVVAVRGTHDCVVRSGILYDRYTGRTITFERGPNSADVQIDHVVALSDAWQKGAQQLDPLQRTSLANDPLNLVATDGPTNQSKGDSDAASWLPPNKSARCAYVARQIAVKQRYHLWVTAAERYAMDQVLASCPAEPLPVS
ncbi:HNH endonuclease family protein [Pseudonocardia sp. CA-107938]|uniref:HNH endonuclease family protein n=1 Tax=Pseudonocardia sp. CA-107938 TaxID=3240021 RepID=UPI003D94BA89